MNKIFLCAALCIPGLLPVNRAMAQAEPALKGPSYRIAIFAPLYLDSVFNNNTFRYSQGIPKFMAPALDFVQGAQIALDSLPVDNHDIEAHIYDSKSYTSPISYLVSSKSLDSINLIIGNVRDDDYRALADFAQQHKVPFISATYPNDAGITNNPYVVIMNSTLRAHCDAIYTYLLQNHGTDNIFLCRQAGNQEDMVAGYFKQANEPDGKPLLNIQTINFGTNFSPEYLKSRLDSNSKTVIIGGSLDETFAGNITAACSSIHKTYPITLIGMPTWDGFTSLRKKGSETVPVIYTAPYYNGKWDVYSKMVINGYTKKYKGKPSDMAFKGFESVYLFTRMLMKYPDDFMNQLNDHSLKVFNEYNFRPVMVRKQNTDPDYYENKHLYFLKIQNGTVTKAW